MSVGYSAGYSRHLQRANGPAVGVDHRSDLRVWSGTDAPLLGPPPGQPEPGALLSMRLDRPDDTQEASRRPARYRVLRPAEVDELVATYHDGATVYELGDRFGISRQTVSKTLKRQGVTMRLQSLTVEQIDEAVRLYGAGWSVGRIAERISVYPQTVMRRLHERNVRMRDTHGRER